MSDKNKKEVRQIPKTAFENPIFEWLAFEHIPHQRGKVWHIAAGTFILAMVIYAILSNSISMAVVFLLLAGVYKLVHSEDPRVFKTSITELGIRYGEEVIVFSRIKGFWLVYNPPVAQLHLIVPDRFPQEIVIQLGDQDPNSLRDYLVRQIPEYESRNERMIDVISRFLKL